MSNIQIRNVPPELHRTLKERAAKAGMSLSDYLLVEIKRIAALPTFEEMTERLRKRPPVQLSESSAAAIRRMRDSG